MKHTEAFLQSFLAQLEEHLAGIPAERRQEIVAETRMHLESMLAARRMDGWDEVSACQDVRRAFGEPEAVGAEFSREWRRSLRSTPLEKTSRLWSQLYQVAPYMLVTVALMPLLVAHSLSGPFVYFLLALNGGARVWRHYQRMRKLNPLLISLLIVYSSCFIIVTGEQLRAFIQGNIDGYFLLCGVLCAWCLIIFLELLWMMYVCLRTMVSAWRRSCRSTPASVVTEKTHRLEQVQTLLVGTGTGVILSVFGGLPSLDMTITLLMCFVAMLFPTVNRKWPTHNYNRTKQI